MNPIGRKPDCERIARPRVLFIVVFGDLRPSDFKIESGTTTSQACCETLDPENDARDGMKIKILNGNF